MFLVKKIVGPMLLPLSLCLGILLVGIILLWFSRKQRGGRILVSIGFVLLLAFGYEATSDPFLKPLERKYPPLKELTSLSHVKWVVVLGGGHTSDFELPFTSMLTEASLVRLAEGIRIHRKLPGSKLLLSGGGVFDPASDAAVMAEVALSLGVDREDLVLEELSRDTKDQARWIWDTVGKDPFILVTSASHMPRSAALFRKLGMEPIPAPTNHLVKEDQAPSPGDFFPYSDNIRKVERAFYEYLGMAWAWMRGQI